MNGRDDIERELQALGALEVPGPDDAFVDALEARLLGEDAASPVVALPLHRRRRMSAVAMVAASLAFTGVAAAAGVVAITHQFRDDPAIVTTTTPTTAVSSTTTTTSEVPTTTVAVTTPVVRTVPATEPPTTMPTTVPASVPPVRPTTVPPTTKPTAPPTTAAVTTTTEVKLPPTMTLECFLEVGSVHCRWSAGPDGTAKYAILRSTLENPAGTVTVVGPGDLAWIDPVQVPGVTAGYVVHALDANGVSLAHTPLVKATCC